MDQQDAKPIGDDEVRYEPPAVEYRTSGRDPLVWINPASPICL